MASPKYITNFSRKTPVSQYNVKRQPPESNIHTQRGVVDWLTRNVTRGRNEVFIVPQTLTPTLARELLNRNPDNRTLVSDTVEQFKRTMLAGEWDGLNGEMVKITKCGLLNDGQHRLKAFLETGIENMPMIFLFGVDRESRKTLDQGRLRTAADYLTMDGYNATRYASAIALMLWQWRTFRTISKRRETHVLGKSEIASYAIKYWDQIDYSLRVIPRRGSAPIGGVPLLAFAHLIFTEIAGPDAASEFILKLAHGNNLPNDSPILSARNRLVRSTKERLTRGERLELIIRAWNAWCEGRTLANIPIHNSYPEIKAPKFAVAEPTPIEGPHADETAIPVSALH